MSRGTIVYLGMCVLLVAGLWAILRAGSRLRAPEDLAGRWELRAVGPGKNAARHDELVIGQSGLFLDVAFSPGPRLGMKIVDQQPAPDGTIAVKLAGGGAELTATGGPGGDEFQLQGTGAAAGLWEARRTARRYGSPATPDSHAR